MRKFLLALSVIAMATPAVADPYHHHQEPPRQRHGNAGAWVAGAIGLGVLGAIIANDSRPRCTEELIGYDRFGNEVWKRYCN